MTQVPESAIILGLSTRYNPFFSELHPVANIKSAKKRAKQTVVRNARIKALKAAA